MTMRLPFIRILLTYCASTVVGKSNQCKRKRLITCEAPYASSGFIYTHPVNSTASEFGWSPDHYLTIHSAVSQPYLKGIALAQPLAPLTFIRWESNSGKELGRRLYGCIPMTNLFYKYKRLRRRSAKRKKKREKKTPSTRRSTEQKVFVFRSVWEMTHRLTNVSLVWMHQTFVCECREVIAWKNIFSF